MSIFDKANIDKINCLIDLHLHLDGALSLNNIKDLIQISGYKNSYSDDELIDKIQVSKYCTSLNEFLSKFDFPLCFLQTKKTIAKSITNLLNEQQQQGLIYCEVRFAPQLHMQKGLTMDEVVEAAIDGCKKANIPSSLILCCMEGASKELNVETVNVAAKYKGDVVKAIDLAGAEGLFKLEDHEYIFDLAKQNNLPFTIHAGEAKGAENVDLAIKFGTKRIGHGVHASDNEETCNSLFDNHVTLEMCPTSNLQTRAISDIKNFPFVRFFEKGIYVTINQDDPSISGIDLKHEWKLMIDNFEMTYLEVKQVLMNSVNASFLELDQKLDLVKKINDNFKLID